MADTTTISELTETQTLAETYKILIEDTNGAGQALLGSAFSDKINGALAEYEQVIQDVTSIENCIPSTNEKVKVCRVRTTIDGVGGIWVIETKYIKHDSTGDRYLVQLAQQVKGDTTNALIYKRNAYSTNGGTTWNYSNWVKVVTESELSNYGKIQRIQVPAKKTVRVYLGNTSSRYNGLNLMCSTMGNGAVYMASFNFVSYGLESARQSFYDFKTASNVIKEYSTDYNGFTLKNNGSDWLYLYVQNCTENVPIIEQID